MESYSCRRRFAAVNPSGCGTGSEVLPEVRCVEVLTVIAIQWLACTAVPVGSPRGQGVRGGARSLHNSVYTQIHTIETTCP